jgi:hypothetical protein
VIEKQIQPGGTYSKDKEILRELLLSGNHTIHNKFDASVESLFVNKQDEKCDNPPTQVNFDNKAIVQNQHERAKKKTCNNCRYSNNPGFCSQMSVCTDWAQKLEKDENWPTYDEMRRKRFGELRNRGK